MAFILHKFFGSYEKNIILSVSHKSFSLREMLFVIFRFWKRVVCGFDRLFALIYLDVTFENAVCSISFFMNP